MMKREILRLTSDFVVFMTEQSQKVGTETNLEIELPKDIDLECVPVSGTVTDCRHVLYNGCSRYLIKMNIGDMTKQNRMILDAYIDFLKREKALEKMRKDNEELQQAVQRLEDKLSQLIVVSELLIKESRGELVIH